jgi:hypothetical protein
LDSIEAVNQIKIKAPPKLASLSTKYDGGWVALKGSSRIVSTADDRASIDASIPLYFM